jgi:hypothetical protein
MADLTVGLNCPACGGAVTTQEGEGVVNCKYCGSTLLIEGDKGVSTIAFKNKMDRGRVIQASETWWRRGLKARDLKKVGKVTEVYPIYIPFWSTMTRIAGWVCGYEERTRSDGKHTYTEKVPKEVMVLEEYHYSNIACDPGDLGIRSLKNFSGEKTLEDFLMIPTFETTSSSDDARKQAETEAVAYARKKANVPHITFESIQAIPRGMSIIYYPIWVVRYSYRERMYMTSVDGVSGEVLSGRAPGDPLYQSLAITLGSSLGGIASAAGLLIGMEAESGYPVIIGLAFGIGMFYFAYRFFRSGSEIVEGEFSGKKGFQAPSGMGQIQEAIRQVGELGR